ncbi:hypothetical protein ES288_A08G219300v1 [Gossypium darwinii]|uniref:Uncharacterized protein n=1 Tax=Gossypium darwinii TaxID=34276 RepID=A0A5D2FM88_GOSDA|nr:hypothetical protein ES288_A08G219300v1 [Gossypium darwinii]
MGPGRIELQRRRTNLENLSFRDNAHPTPPNTRLPPTLNKKNRELPCSLPLFLLFYFLLGFQRNPSLPPFNRRATTALGGRRYTKMGSFSSPIFYLLEASSKNEKTRVQPPF